MKTAISHWFLNLMRDSSTAGINPSFIVHLVYRFRGDRDCCGPSTGRLPEQSPYDLLQRVKTGQAGRWRTSVGACDVKMRQFKHVIV